MFQQSYMLNDATKTMYEGINRVYYIDNHKNVWMAQEGGIDRIAFLNTNFEYLSTSSALVRACTSIRAEEFGWHRRTEW